MKNRFLLKMITLSLMFCSFYASVFSQTEVNPVTDGRWTISSNGVTYIPVCWENSEGFSTEIQWVKSAIEETWEYYANIDFQGWRECVADSRGIRILIKDNRSNSHLGKYMNGVYGGMELNFTFRNFSPSCQRKKEGCIKSIAVHEFGHALGLAHEQDRADSICYEGRSLRGNTIAITEYDPFSVMNYCNPDWNNNGKLSNLDIKGIQIIYGKKNGYDNGYGYVSISDELGKDQIWEEVRITLNNSFKSFTITKSQPSQKIEWSFSGTGNYCFKFSTRALHSDSKIYSGYGEKCFNLENGKRYSTLSMSRNGWNSGGYFNLVLE